MAHYEYIGADPFLIGQAALGRIQAGFFAVQVDSLNHLWAHGWHRTPRDEWQEIL